VRKGKKRQEKARKGKKRQGKARKGKKRQEIPGLLANASWSLTSKLLDGG
jgi:hypothetical protein